MHTKIRTSKSLGRVLRYHERKVNQRLADCLYAGNMLKDAGQLTRREKQFHLERLQTINDRAIRKTVHIFLSWDQSDVMDNEKMRTIAREFMQKMELDKQPYLIYRHWDTLHPHAHVVTTNIRNDGTMIDLWRSGRVQRFHLVRELEEKYGLYRAGRRIPDEEWKRKHPAQKVVHGVTPLKPTINAVLEAVIRTYKFTTLEELNAVLRPYNIRASQGREGSLTRRNRGLLYWPLKDSGERETTYIKSSVLGCRPTLKNLEERFILNKGLREEYRQRLTTAIDWIFHEQQLSEEAFRQAMRREGIHIAWEPDGYGGLRNLFYLDQVSKTVWAGEALGKPYTAEGIARRCIPEEDYRQQQQQKHEQKQRQRHRQRHDLY